MEHFIGANKLEFLRYCNTIKLILANPFIPIYENKFIFYLCSSFYFSAVEKTAEMSTRKSKWKK